MSLSTHDSDEDGFHDEDECELCIERNHSVCNACRCGNCCEGLLLEASLRDAEREPRITECSPIVDDIRTGEREIIGYMLYADVCITSTIRTHGLCRCWW